MGDIQDKYRFLKEVYEETRRLVGKDFPIITKINAIATRPNDTIYQQEFVELLKLIEKTRFDAVEISGALYIMKQKTIRQSMKEKIVKDCHTMKMSVYRQRTI